MKLKTLLAGLLTTFLLQHTVLSQTNTAPADESAVAVDTNTTVTATETVTNTTAADATATAVATEVVATNAPAAPTGSPSIPLIQFQDVPLTTAIENLARQADIKLFARS
ncbi:MAG: hypothetical protein WDN00_14940 [Limisphaerales bacterium]